MAQRVEREHVDAQWARPGTVRGTVLTLYARAMRGWQKAPGEIARGLREARHLHSRERRFVGEALHGMVRMRTRLAFLAGLDAAEDATPSPDALYLVWLLGARTDDGRAVVDAAADELARIGISPATVEAGPTRLLAIVDPAERLALTASYPRWLVARLFEALGEASATAFFEASNHRAPLCARANTLKITRHELIQRLSKDGVKSAPIPLVTDGLELLSHHNAYGLAAFQEGLFELQDTASQLVAEVVAPPPRGRVLDLCAGAGGKTLHLAALLGGGGRITATDVIDDKLDELRKRARRAGATNIEARLIERTGALPFEGPYDRVLVDAPCTGSGVLRRNPEARWRLGPHDLEELPREQAAILRRAAPLVADGGRLVYVTCSILREENDAIVKAFLEENKEFESVLLKEVLGTERALQIGDGERLRTSPDRQGTDGFFGAVLRRRVR